MSTRHTIDQGKIVNLRGTSFPLADANGNCVSFIDNTGNVQAHYVYDAFGGTVSSDGDMADVFRFRFSSKYLDDETGLYYYGYRYYAPAWGRLISWQVSDEIITIKYAHNLYNIIGNEVRHLHVGFEALALLPGIPLGSVECNITGNDGEPLFFGKNNDNNSTRQCTGLHEYQHIKDRRSCCQKARETYQKTGKGIIIAQWNAYIRLSRDWSECRAYEKSLSCAEKLKCKVPEEQENWLDNYIKESAKRKKEHCNKSSGPWPCPF